MAMRIRSRVPALLIPFLSACIAASAESQGSDDPAAIVPNVNDGAWSSFAPPPAPRYDHFTIFDPSLDRMILFGGSDSYTVFLDIWDMPFDGSPRWEHLDVSGSGPFYNYGLKGVLDTVGNRIVMTSANGNDFIWFMSMGGSPSWSHVYPAGLSPQAPQDFSVIYDPPRNRVLAFGGSPFGQSQGVDTVWALALGGTPTWSRLGTTGTPPAGRRRHCAIYDPTRDRMLIFGGDNGAATFFNDVWALSLGTPTPQWTQVIATGSPPVGRDNSSAIYDPVRDRMVIFGGYRTSALSDTWALSLSGSVVWTQLAPTDAPTGCYRHSAIYDPNRDRMVVHGGLNPELSPTATTRFLTWGAPVAVRGAWSEGGTDAGIICVPNPSTRGAIVRFELRNSTEVQLSIVDLAGRIVRGFAARDLPAGGNTFSWDGRRDDGGMAAAGVYFVHLSENGQTRTSKLILTR